MTYRWLRNKMEGTADETSFSVTPATTDWDTDTATQHEALAACWRADDHLGVARARNALGLLCLRRGYDSSAWPEFQESLRTLAAIGDEQWTPVVRMHLAECMIAKRFYQDAEEVLTETLAVFRERGDTSSEATALDLLGMIQQSLDRSAIRACRITGIVDEYRP